MFRRFLCVSFIAAVILSAASSAAFARVRLENICTLAGTSEVKLVGVGLVTGLNGTGDSPKNAPAMRALAQFLKVSNAPAEDLKDLKNVKNVALVQITATIPRTGIRRGQKVDCIVSALFDATDLRGGQLLSTPLEDAVVEKKNPLALGLASGSIIVEDPKFKTNGRIPGGVIVQKDFLIKFISPKGYITLVLDKNHASFYAANEIANVINEEFRVEASKPIAIPVGADAIRVYIPKSYMTVPLTFVAYVMNVSINQPHIQARVIINEKSNTVVVTGEVEFSPVVVAIDGLQVTSGSPGAGGGSTAGGLAGVPDRRNPQSTENLRNLIDSLKELRVPTADIIKIIRTINRSGKLHAVLIEE